MTSPVYLDHNATTPLAASVADVIATSLVRDWANPGSDHAPGRQAKKAVDDARGWLAAMLNAQPSDIVFTSGGTEASNMVLQAVPELHRDAVSAAGGGGDSQARKAHVITSNVEHDATVLPLRRLQQLGQIDVTEVAVDARGVIRVDDVIEAIRPNTFMISLMLANNETGVVMPVKQIASRLREVNRVRTLSAQPRVLLHTDAAQALGKMAVDVEQLGVDYLSLTGHKFYGPRCGCVFARGLGEGHTPLLPLLFGGGQEGGRRPGTLNAPLIAGLGEAARLVAIQGAQFADKMADTRDWLERCLERAFGASVAFNCRDPAVPRLANTCNMSLLPPLDVGAGASADLRGHLVLARCPGLLASVASCCHDQHQPSAVLIRSGVDPKMAANAIRLSVGRDTTREDVEMAVDQLQSAYQEIIGKHL